MINKRTRLNMLTIKSSHLPLLVLVAAIISSSLRAATAVKIKGETNHFDTMTRDEPSASSSNINNNIEQFSCTLAAKDESSCDAATADDGTHCVWCSISGLGFCLSNTQAKAMEKVIPTIKCDDHKTDDAVHPPTVAPSSNNDPNNDIWKCLDKSDEMACKKGGSSTCTWCTTKKGFGLCLAPVEADFASNSTWFDCAKHNQGEGDEVKPVEDVEDEVLYSDNTPSVSDLDTSCLVASLEQDASFCQSTKDATSNAACQWCHVTSAPSLQLCLSAEQAEMASVFVSCDAAPTNQTNVATTTTSSSSSLEDPLDMSCVEASMIQDETVCESTMDATGAACEWCSIPRVPYHVCLSKDQANLVSSIVICVKPPATAPTTPKAVAVPAIPAGTSASDFNKMKSAALLRGGHVMTDVTTTPQVQDFDTSCLMASLEQDASACQATKDATSGEACEWCHVTAAPSLQLCLSTEQAALASTLVSCDASYSQDEIMEQNVDDPTDLTCLQVSLLQDESACESTSDTSGAACEWCSVPNVPFHVCLSQEQASLVAGYVTCSSSPSSAPAVARATDSVAIDTNVAFPSNFIKCLKTLDETSCEAGACTWCGTQLGFGVCLANPSAAATDNCPFFDCNGPHTNETNLVTTTTSTGTETASTITPDANCWAAAGMTSNVAKAVCHTTLDQQGNNCMWCLEADSGVGLCLSYEHGHMAKGLHCSSSEGESWRSEQ
jgi:hypothetical protein